MVGPRTSPRRTAPQRRHPAFRKQFAEDKSLQAYTAMRGGSGCPRQLDERIPHTRTQMHTERVMLHRAMVQRDRGRSAGTALLRLLQDEVIPPSYRALILDQVPQRARGRLEEACLAGGDEVECHHYRDLDVPPPHPAAIAAFAVGLALAATSLPCGFTPAPHGGPRLRRLRNLPREGAGQQQQQQLQCPEPGVLQDACSEGGAVVSAQRKLRPRLQKLAAHPAHVGRVPAARAAAHRPVWAEPPCQAEAKAAADGASAAAACGPAADLPASVVFGVGRVGRGGGWVV